MTLTHYWLSGDAFKILEIETGREQTVVIPGTDLLEPQELNEWMQVLMEEAANDFKKPENPGLTKEQQHDLGGALMDIRAFKHKKSETGSGRLL